MLAREPPAEVAAGLAQGRRRRARDMQRWLEEEHATNLSLGETYCHSGKAGGVLNVPRKTHAKKDAALGLAFQEELAGKLAELPLEVNRPMWVWWATSTALV